MSDSDLRLAFDEDPGNYDRWRPRYCDTLFSKITSFSGLSSAKTAVEIGCGTGQATEPLLKAGAKITAVEIGENLTGFCRKKFRHYPNFHVENIAFEDVSIEDGSIDLVYSATAFHWIPEEVSYSKVFRMLRSGGTIALFWNRPYLDREAHPSHFAVDSVYQRYNHLFQRGNGAKRVGEDTYQRIIENLKNAGFFDIELSLSCGSNVIQRGISFSCQYVFRPPETARREKTTV